MPSNFLKSKSWSISFSLNDCPYTHLAIEKYLLDGNFNGDSHLFFYRNSPSIVFGRFQVPWREINIPRLREISGIKLVRRRSGGGTVYHDLGNWNFCILHKQRTLKREENLSLIQALLAGVGISVVTNERFDLLSEDGRKVSGSAFKQKKEAHLHHGTLLMRAKLSDLRGVLGTHPEWTVTGKGIRSNPSQVVNLCELYHWENGSLEFGSWLKSVEEFFKAHLNLLSVQQWPVAKEMLPSVVKAESSELSSWDWVWGETPEFSIESSQGESLTLKKGIITSSDTMNWSKLIGFKAMAESAEEKSHFSSAISDYNLSQQIFLRECLESL